MSSSFFRLQRGLVLAARNLFAAKWRMYLSLVTMLFGSIAIVATFTINSNVDRFINNLIEKTGGPILRMMLPPRPGVEFSHSDIELVKGIPTVYDILPDLETDYLTLRQGESYFTPSLIGVSPHYYKAQPLDLIDGQLISNWDLNDSAMNIVISPDTSKNLGLTDPIGQIISGRYGTHELVFRVIGIAKKDLPFSTDRGDAWVSDRVFQHVMGNNKLIKILVRLKSEIDMDITERAIKQIFKDKFRKDLRVLNPRADLEMLKTQMKALVYAGMTLGFMALIAGAIGIMNVMLVGIRLRRREIGLYKAIGFSGQLIRTQFLIESFLLSLIGGLMGSVVGSFLGIRLSDVLVKPFHYFSSWAFAIGVLVTAIIGGLFGIIPAVQASKMDPVEALRG